MIAMTMIKSSESMKVLVNFWLFSRPKPQATTLIKSRQILARHR